MTFHDLTTFDLARARPQTTAAMRIAVVDNDRATLSHLEEVLRAAGFLVDAYADAIPAQQALLNKAPDLVLLAVSLTRLDGLTLLRQLRDRSPDLPVILSHEGDSTAEEILALSLGADDFVRKPFAPRVLVERIRACLRRSDRASGTARAVSVGPLEMDAARYRTTLHGKRVVLTATEFHLLHALAEHPGKVQTRTQLMSVIYADDIYVDERTVDSHIKRLRKKLRALDPGFDAIKTLYGVGYHFETPVAHDDQQAKAANAAH